MLAMTGPIADVFRVAGCARAPEGEFDGQERQAVVLRQPGDDSPRAADLLDVQDSFGPDKAARDQGGQEDKKD